MDQHLDDHPDCEAAPNSGRTTRRGEDKEEGKEEGWDECRVDAAKSR